MTAAPEDMFAVTLTECIFDAVRLELGAGQGNSEECLQNHIAKMAVFMEVDRSSLGIIEGELVGWMTATVSWIAAMRKHCRAWILLAENEHRDSGIEVHGGRQLTFQELLESVASLRNSLTKASEKMENLSIRGRDMEAQAQGLNRGYTAEWAHFRTDSPLEEGEIEQDADAIRTAQWEQFKEVKNLVSDLANNKTREGRLREFDRLERHICPSMLTPTRSGVLRLDRVIASSIKDVKRESDRVLVEIEDELLRFKAIEYARLWKVLECVGPVISGLLYGHSDLTEE